MTRPPWHSAGDEPGDTVETVHSVVPFRAPSTPAAAAPPSVRERELLTAWREAHWALQERLRELPPPARHEVDRLYQAARMADTDLTALYQRRAEALARQVRDLLVQRVSDASAIAPTTSVPPNPPTPSATGEVEMTLLTWFRTLSAEDRATATSLIERLARR